MRHMYSKVLVASAFLFGSFSLQAQVYGRGSYENGRVYAEFGRSYNDRDGIPNFLDRVRRDLDHAESATSRYASNRDRGRFNKVREEISEFQNKWYRGKYDRHELDDVIKNLQHVLRDNALGAREADLLRTDLDQLRDLRARS